MKYRSYQYIFDFKGFMFFVKILIGLHHFKHRMEDYPVYGTTELSSMWML